MKPWFPLQGNLPYTKISGSINEGYNPSAPLQFSLPSKYICLHQNLHSTHYCKKCYMWLFMWNKMHVKRLSMMQDNGRDVQIMARVNYWWNRTLKEQSSCQTCLILHAWTIENAKTTCCEEVTCCLCSTLCCTNTINRKICEMYVKGFFFLRLVHFKVKNKMFKKYK